MAHLARANPFNAPHLQLVHDGLSGPRNPPGPPRRSRHLAAAAVEGEVTACPGRALVSRCPFLCLRGPGRGWRSGKGAPALDGSLAVPGMSTLTPMAAAGSLALPQGRGRAQAQRHSVTSVSPGE